MNHVRRSSRELPAEGVRGRLAAVILLIVVLGHPQIGAAQSAEALFRKALVNFSMAEFEQSIQLLHQAKDNTEDPKLLSQIHFYLAANLDILERTSEAESAMVAALTYNPDFTVEAERFKDSTYQLWQRSRQTMHGVLVVTADPKAAVWVDQKRRGLTPLKLRLPIGTHQLKLLTEGKTHRAQAQVVVFFEQTTKINIPLHRIEGTLTLTTTPPGAEVLVAGQVIGKTPLKEAILSAGSHSLTVRLEQAHEENIVVRIPPDKNVKVQLTFRLIEIKVGSQGGPPPHSRLWTWLLTGGSAATLATSLGLGLAALADHRQWENKLALPPPQDLQAMADLKETGQTKQLAANILLGLGSALAVAAVVTFFLDRPEKKTKGTRTQVGPWLMSEGAPHLSGQGGGILWSAHY